ncbi:hypothetical protein KUTeg_013839 [Tegillarca granosa]|uniref:Uncharacterized protein n=1 Tax=Tegillarca granosa TaxID=220873 RepID=A0ABQ9EYP0_TEGGR|nr:hypothetical protein KUTeg_013839 [Tegillarca granosa]
MALLPYTKNDHILYFNVVLHKLDINVKSRSDNFKWLSYIFPFEIIHSKSVLNVYHIFSIKMLNVTWCTNRNIPIRTLPVTCNIKSSISSQWIDYNDISKSKRLKRDVSTNLYSPIRIFTFYSELEVELVQKDVTKLKLLVDQAVQYTSGILSVIPVQGLLLLKRTTGCLKYWVKGQNIGKCSTLDRQYKGEFCHDNLKKFIHTLREFQNTLNCLHFVCFHLNNICNPCFIYDKKIFKT